MRVLFCIPILDDWESANLLLARIGQVASSEAWDAEVLFVDDGSVDPWEGALSAQHPGIASVDVLELRRNLGHQRAIAIALAHIYENRKADAVVVMDGDGEDKPESVPQLLAAMQGSQGGSIVFARRTRRMESVFFKVLYQAFRLFHRIFVGHRVEVGNFSVIPFGVLDRLMGVGELWNHYAASVEKARIPITKVPTARGSRLAGSGKMNFVALATHGLSAMSVWSEEIGVRLLMASALLMVTSIGALGGLLFWAGGGGGAIAGWVLVLAGLLGVTAVNGLLLSVIFSFLVLKGRGAATFLPIRDYRHYVGQSRRVEARRDS
jgi:hypothetical protein